MGHRLPNWAEEPLDVMGAAKVMGCSKNTFLAILKRHPHYEIRGRRKKVFYPENINAIREG
jgi:hypothetical protein